MKYEATNGSVELSAMDRCSRMLKVGRCRLTVSKSVLKAPILSGLETTI
jgi:hypothetical protein